MGITLSLAGNDHFLEYRFRFAVSRRIILISILALVLAGDLTAAFGVRTGE